MFTKSSAERHLKNREKGDNAVRKRWMHNNSNKQNRHKRLLRSQCLPRSKFERKGRVYATTRELDYMMYNGWIKVDDLEGGALITNMLGNRRVQAYLTGDGQVTFQAYTKGTIGEFIPNCASAASRLSDMEYSESDHGNNGHVAKFMGKGKKFSLIGNAEKNKLKSLQSLALTPESESKRQKNYIEFTKKLQHSITVFGESCQINKNKNDFDLSN